MHGLADRRVFHVQIVADGRDDDLAGIHADPDRDRHAVGPLHFFRIAGDALLHPQRSITGPHRVILMGDRRAEQRHDAVAEHAVDGALIAMDGIDHQLDHGVEKLLRILHVAAGNHLQRAFDVGKQHRDLLALAFQRRLGRENFVDQMLRRVIARRRIATVPDRR
jgi:hypothetical protein